MAGSGQGAPFNGDWIDGAGTAAAFYYPYGVAVDASGNVLVADQNNHRMRRVTPSGGTRPLTGSRGRGRYFFVRVSLLCVFICFLFGSGTLGLLSFLQVCSSC